MPTRTLRGPVARRLLLLAAGLCPLFGVAVAEAADAPSGIVVLPVVTEDEIGTPATALEASLAEVVRAAGGVLLDLPEALPTDGRCRRDPPCVADHLPPGALAFDLEVRPVAEGTSLVVYDLRLVRGDRWLSRTSAAVAPNALRDAVTEAAARLLSYRRPELRLYDRAKDGDADAAARLVAEHPDSPWTRAFLLKSRPARTEP